MLRTTSEAVFVFHAFLTFASDADLTEDEFDLGQNALNELYELLEAQGIDTFGKPKT